MLSIQRVDKVGHLLTEFDRWAVHEMVLTPEKLKLFWEEFQKMPTLFSDMTRGDMKHFVNTFLDSSSFYMEVYDAQKMVGILYLTDMNAFDCTCHILFFDRAPHEKIALCRHVLRWCFQRFHFHRMSAQVPHIYSSLFRLTKRIGFKIEGKKRQVTLVGSKWVDEFQLGLLASEMD